MKTSHIRAVDIEERWYVYDASQFLLGRMASDIAMKLMGKDRPTWTPSELTGAHVIVINADQVRLSGKKDETKEYQRYSGYPGGLHVTSLADKRERRPQEIVKLAVRRMLPKTKLGKRMLSNLKVYGGSAHPHEAQQPVAVESTKKPS
ncbi:MAG: 50S ribosomal protein L13 [Planctomycetota bacterium]